MATFIFRYAPLLAIICAYYVAGSPHVVRGSDRKLQQSVVQQQAGSPASVMQPGTAYSPQSNGGVTDTDVLYFAYNLECFEAQFYSCAAFGYPLNTNITGNGPAPSSCTKAALSSEVGTYAAELSREETMHVTDLHAALKAAGVDPICPSVNIDSAFEAAAEVAFGVNTTLSPIFNPASNDDFFLLSAWIFEDLGCSAYLGAQSLISDPDYRKVAGQIGNTEAYHSSLLRTELYKMLDFAPAYGKTIRQITQAIVAELNTLSGSPQLKYNIFNSQGSHISNVDSKAYVPAATVGQVLNTVTFGAAKGQGGGFFPENLNGNVKN